MEALPDCYKNPPSVLVASTPSLSFELGSPCVSGKCRQNKFWNAPSKWYTFVQNSENLASQMNPRSSLHLCCSDIFLRKQINVMNQKARGGALASETEKELVVRLVPRKAPNTYVFYTTKLPINYVIPCFILHLLIR